MIDLFNLPPKFDLSTFRPRLRVRGIDPIAQRAAHLATYADPAERLDALKVAMLDARAAREVRS